MKINEQTKARKKNESTKQRQWTRRRESRCVTSKTWMNSSTDLSQLRMNRNRSIAQQQTWEHVCSIFDVWISEFFMIFFSFANKTRISTWLWFDGHCHWISANMKNFKIFKDSKKKTSDEINSKLYINNNRQISFCSDTKFSAVVQLTISDQWRFT